MLMTIWKKMVIIVMIIIYSATDHDQNTPHDVELSCVCMEIMIKKICEIN